MRRLLWTTIAACSCGAGITSLSRAEAAPAAAVELYTVDAKTPAGLRELFKPGADRLPLLSAHRGGAAADRPENCLATFEDTVRHAWSMLEIDLRYTKDGKIVLHHDPMLTRTTNGTGRVEDRTLAELRELRLKDRNGKLTNQRIPTLDDAMEWARGRTILVLDKKELPVKDVVAKIAEHHAESYALLMAYSIKDITECHSLNRDVMMEVMIGTPQRFDEFDRSGVPWANIIAFVGHTQTPDPELCRRIRARGASCMAGSSRNLDRQFLGRKVETMDALRPEYRAMLERGVDVIETDIPRELWPVLYRDQPIPAAKTKFFHAPTSGDRR